MNADSEPLLILITGIMASGKSAVAEAVARRLPRCVHLRGDLFRRMIVSGRAEVGFELSPQALEQLMLRYRIAAAVAGMYLAAGFSVVYQDIIIGRGLSEVLPLHAHAPFHIVVLCPTPQVVAAREAARGKRGYLDCASIAAFDRVLRTETPRVGLWVDNSAQGVEETADFVMSHLEDARVDRRTVG